MMRFIYGLLLFCWACEPYSKEGILPVNKLYIISKEDSLVKATLAKHSIPPPSHRIYAHYNFIVNTADIST